MPTPPIPNQKLEILEKAESYEDSDKGYQFAGTLVLYQLNGLLYHGRLKGRSSSPSDINADDIMNVKQIPTSAYNPNYSIEFTLAPENLLNSCYTKKPQLLSYDRVSEGPQPNLIAEDVLKEARVYEVLMQHPHPNIATSLGCQVSDGRITGLCLEKYPRTLMKEVNPGALMKRALRNTREVSEDYSRVLIDVESGLYHLHSLGLVHNDLNPSNIMVADDRAVIIDFGSCRKTGESLEYVGRTYEWHDEKIQQSLPENDLTALEEIRIWLGLSLGVFQFDV
jgi:serine/threonine protein kinase